MNIYLFFNNPCRLPEDGDKWNNWQDPDTTKLAWVCGESWRRAGWAVKRLPEWCDCGCQECFAPFTGRLKASIEFYPLEYWQFWYQAKAICRREGPSWFTTIDVINFGLRADNAQVRAMNIGGPFDIVTLQAQHFSASALRLTENGCLQAIDLIKRYDLGEFAPIPVDLVSDETILRFYGKYSNLKLCAYPVEENAHLYPLIHVTKSTLARLFDSDAHGAINQ